MYQRSKAPQTKTQQEHLIDLGNQNNKDISHLNMKIQKETKEDYVSDDDQGNKRSKSE